MPHDETPPERPRSEPEIIPPRHGREADWRRSPWRGGVFDETRGTHRIHVARLGPFGLALLILVLAAVAAIIMIAVLGAVLIWIPVAVALVIIAAVFRLLRG